MTRPSIRDMIESAKYTPCGTTTQWVGGKKFKAWANGHVRVDGVHRMISGAQATLDEASSAPAV